MKFKINDEVVFKNAKPWYYTVYKEGKIIKIDEQNNSYLVQITIVIDTKYLCIILRLPWKKRYKEKELLLL